MRKLTLDLSSLVVQSFSTDALGTMGPGTVRARETKDDADCPSADACPTESSCGESDDCRTKHHCPSRPPCDTRLNCSALI